MRPFACNSLQNPNICNTEKTVVVMVLVVTVIFSQFYDLILDLMELITCCKS